MGEDKIVSRSYLSVCSRAACMHTRPGVQECCYIHNIAFMELPFDKH